MVPRAGLEPARIYIRGILSPLRLPIPPSRHNYFFNPTFANAPVGYPQEKLILLLRRSNKDWPYYAHAELRRAYRAKPSVSSEALCEGGSFTRRLEAAPRFELGIKVLQTRALPLGYAATNNSIIYLQKVNILNVA